MAEEKNKYAAIKKNTQTYKKQSRFLKEFREENICNCDHQEKSGPALTSTKNGFFTCEKCEKDNIRLDKNMLDENALKQHVDYVDQILDIIKLNLKKDNEADMKLLKKTAKCQFYLRVILIPLVNSIKKKDRNKKKKDKSGESAWGKTRTM